MDNLDRGQGRTDAEQRAQIDLINRLNKRHRDQHPHEADLAARIESFELAYRMQMAAPEALDVNREPGSRPGSSTGSTTRVAPTSPSNA